MNSIKIALITLSLTATIGCGSALSDTKIHNGLNTSSKEVTERDAFGNTTHMEVIDERDPYKFCLSMHPNAQRVCDNQNALGASIMIGAAPNVYAGSALGGGWSQPPANNTPNAATTSSNDGPTKEQMTAVVGRVQQNSDDIVKLNRKVNKGREVQSDAGK